jgi:hypothetical protein
MRSLLAYLLAISAFLGTTYVGLEWLSEPTRPIIQHTADKATAETARDENRARSGGNSEPSDTGPKPPPPNQPAPAPPPGPDQLKSDSQPPATSKPEDAHAGGCAPLGLTAQGNLVFPLECHEPLARNREAGDSETSTNNSSEPAPTENQNQVAEPPAKSAGEQTADQKPADASTKGKLKNENTRPVRQPRPAKEIAEEAPKTGKPEGRPVRNSPPSGMTMIMRTIFPKW